MAGGAGSIPGRTVRTQAAGTPNAAIRCAVKALVTSTPVQAARAWRSQRGQSLWLPRREAGLVGERMVDERQETEPPAMHAGRLGQRSQGQSVDDDPRAVGNVDESPVQAGGRLGVDVWKRAVEFVNGDLPSEPTQPIDHPGIVEVTPRSLVERTGHDHVELGADHTDPS